MRFKYKAQKADGTFYEGQREAADKFALARELRSEGETLISAEGSESGESGMGIRRLIPFLGHISVHEKTVFARNLGGMLSAGLTVSRSLTVLERQTRSQKFKAIISGLGSRINTGESLSQALSAYPSVFSGLVISMVKSGEEGGNLSQSLFAISDQLDRSYLLQRKVRGALMYPSIVMTVMLAVGIILFIYIVPQLTAAFKDFHIRLPLSTRVVIAVSDFLRGHLFLGLLAIAGALLGLVAACKSARGKRVIDRVLLHIPVITPLIKEANTARAAATLSSLLSSGVEVVSALEITAAVLPNFFYKNVLLEARGAIEKGEPISSVFREHENIFPPFLSEMVAVGEETGKLSSMLRDTGAFFEAEVEQKTKNMSTVIEPVLMVVVGAAVGFFAVAMISPIYSLMGSV